MIRQQTGGAGKHRNSFLCVFISRKTSNVPFSLLVKMALKHDSSCQMELTSNVLESNKVWLG